MITENNSYIFMLIQTVLNYYMKKCLKFMLQQNKTRR